ncbi:MAG: rhomboid family intramembrane serine protease, partial [Spirochaetaceae bacterium]|nr:rhomboid family intramembrane serine protease [Spirochaetaceae bacterium]
MNPLRTPFRYTFNYATFWLIGINVFVYLLQKISGDYVSSFFALNVFNVINGKMFWQFISYMFVHSTAGWSHLFFNMLALFIFGM